ETRPIAHLAPADTHQVRQAIATHVGEEDRLRLVGEEHARTCLLIARLPYAAHLPETFLAERRIPHERLVLGDEHVRQAISVEVDEAEISVRPIDVRQILERSKRFPAA